MTTAMDLDAPTPLLAGMSPRAFMRRHWQKRPLLVRAALPLAAPLIDRAALFALAAREDVESRLVVREGRQWRLRRGPLPRRALPALSARGWTLLVQGLDLHLPAARALLDRFRFVPDARLDDVMLSWASDGGGVGAHVDAYDVFLLQVQGCRRWRVGRVADPTPRAGQPLKLLARFAPEHDWLLQPGDMLYLPPGWGHDGVAQGPCMTASIGFRAPTRHELGNELLGRMLDAEDDDARRQPVLYGDAAQPAVVEPARIPAALQRFAGDAVAGVLRRPGALQIALGEWLSEPKPGVTFAPRDARAMARSRGVVLDARTRMLYDDEHVFINGESWRAAGRDAELMHRLADGRGLSAAQLHGASIAARELLGRWLAQGWLDRGEPAALEAEQAPPRRSRRVT